MIEINVKTIICIILIMFFFFLGDLYYKFTSDNVLNYTKVYNNDNYSSFYKSFGKRSGIAEVCFMKNFKDDIDNFKVVDKILIFSNQNDIVKNYCNNINSGTLFEDSNGNSLLTGTTYDNFIMTKVSKTKDSESNIEKLKNHYVVKKIRN